MQRLFSTFPSGAPGLALVLLRISIAWTLVVDAPVHASTPAWIASTAAALLCGGVLTPIVAGMSAVLLFDHAGASSMHPARLSLAIVAAALALLGPGAYSVDAWRFGRRRVVTSADHIE